MKDLQEVQVGDIIKYKMRIDVNTHYTEATESLLEDKKFWNMLSWYYVWTPEEGEWCIFYNENSKGFRVSQFVQIGTGGKVEGLYKDANSNYFERCEPYRGMIPESVLKNAERGEFK